MARVSVTVSQKPKPLKTHKFLRRDEGHMSHHRDPGEGLTPSSRLGSSTSPRAAEARQSLREAIAQDMRSRRAQDPFSEVVVAVPKRAPPPNAAGGSAEQQRQAGTAANRSNSAPPRQPVKRQEWVDESPTGGAGSSPMERRSSGIEPEGPERCRPAPTRQDDWDRPSSAGGAARVPWLSGEAAKAPDSGVALRLGRPYASYSRPHPRPHSVGPSRDPGGADDQIAQQLERELQAARYEREHFLEAKWNLEEEKQRFEAYRVRAQEEMDYAKSRLETQRRDMSRDAQKDTRAMEERHRSVVAMLEQERENNRRLTQENDLLTAQLNELTTTMRETQRVQKAEIARLRRDVESLTHRNKELLDMARQNQLESLETPTPTNSHSHRTRSPAAILNLQLGEGQTVGASSSSSGSHPLPADRNAFQSQADGEAKASELQQRRGGAGKRQQEDGARGSAAVCSAPASTSKEVARERQRDGHPVTTPRAGVAKKAAGVASSSPKVPSREELVGKLEEIPPTNIPNDAVVSTNALGDNPNKREVLYRSGKREIHYANGTTKILLPSGHSILQFVNGDVKRTFPSGRSTYWYDKAQTMHTQIPNGTQLFEFRATGQTERHLPDGEKHILYQDGIYKVVYPDGTEETLVSPHLHQLPIPSSPSSSSPRIDLLKVLLIAYTTAPPAAEQREGKGPDVHPAALETHPILEKRSSKEVRQQRNRMSFSRALCYMLVCTSNIFSLFSFSSSSFIMISVDVPTLLATGVDVL
eukprot:gene4208-3040_t